jgi:hypothetical protein
MRVDQISFLGHRNITICGSGNSATRAYTKVFMIRMLPRLEEMSNLHKNKLKKEGRKLYRSSNGSVYRVTPSRRLARLVLRRKMLRKIEARSNT